MANRDVLAVGSSAGGSEAVTVLAERFLRGFPASDLVTIHLPCLGPPLKSAGAE